MFYHSQLHYRGYSMRAGDAHTSTFLTSSGVKKGLVILDFGCGSGTYTIPAAKLVGATGRVYAVDINSMALDRLERKAEQAGLRNIVRIDVTKEERIPLTDEAVDVMLLIDVLQKIEGKEALFQEAYRLLKPEGVLLIFPMHLAIDAVESLALGTGLQLQDQSALGRILVAVKRFPSESAPSDPR